jgi:hypothetical protein
MPEKDEPASATGMASHPVKAVDELPAGYRQGLVTAISIFVTFSLVFLRYWGFEAPGDWTIADSLTALIIVISLFLQVYTLWRSLQVRDSLIVEYNKTLRWFLASIILIMLGVIVAAVTFAGAHIR